MCKLESALHELAQGFYQQKIKVRGGLDGNGKGYGRRGISIRCMSGDSVDIIIESHDTH